MSWLGPFQEIHPGEGHGCYGGARLWMEKTAGPSSIVRAGSCSLTCRNRSHGPDQTALTVRLKELAAVRVRFGYRRLTILLQREGWAVGKRWV